MKCFNVWAFQHCHTFFSLPYFLGNYYICCCLRTEAPSPSWECKLLKIRLPLIIQSHCPILTWKYLNPGQLISWKSLYQIWWKSCLSKYFLRQILNKSKREHSVKPLNSPSPYTITPSGIHYVWAQIIKWVEGIIKTLTQPSLIQCDPKLQPSWLYW